MYQLVHRCIGISIQMYQLMYWCIIVSDKCIWKCITVSVIHQNIVSSMYQWNTLDTCCICIKWLYRLVHIWCINVTKWIHQMIHAVSRSMIHSNWCINLQWQWIMRISSLTHSDTFHPMYHRCIVWNVSLWNAMYPVNFVCMSELPLIQKPNFIYKFNKISNYSQIIT